MRVFYALKSEVPAGYHTRSVMKGSRVVPMMTLVKASMNPVSDMCLPPLDPTGGTPQPRRRSPQPVFFVPGK